MVGLSTPLFWPLRLRHILVVCSYLFVCVNTVSVMTHFKLFTTWALLGRRVWAWAALLLGSNVRLLAGVSGPVNRQRGTEQQNDSCLLLSLMLDHCLNKRTSSPTTSSPITWICWLLPRPGLPRTPVTMICLIFVRRATGLFTCPVRIERAAVLLSSSEICSSLRWYLLVSLRRRSNTWWSCFALTPSVSVSPSCIALSRSQPSAVRVFSSLNSPIFCNHWPYLRVSC